MCQTDLKPLVAYSWGAHDIAISPTGRKCTCYFVTGSTRSDWIVLRRFLILSCTMGEICQVDVLYRNEWGTAVEPEAKMTREEDSLFLTLNYPCNGDGTLQKK